MFENVNSKISGDLVLAKEVSINIKQFSILDWYSKVNGK